METLTRRQQQVLDCINHTLDRHGIPPTLREIADHLQISGTLGVLKHLQALEKKGCIRKEAGTARGLRVIGRQNRQGVPIIGTVRAGAPHPAIEEIEGYLEPATNDHDGAFYLRVRGDSMIDDAILDGDLALIRPQPTAHNGDIVVALIGDEATIKRFYRDGDSIRLQPANHRLQPLLFRPEDGDDVHIIGKVVSIVRQYQEN